MYYPNEKRLHPAVLTGQKSVLWKVPKKPWIALATMQDIKGLQEGSFHPLI